jgi:ribonuclease R
MVCDMEIGADGEFKDYKFYAAVMFSHARLTYTTVAQIIDEPEGDAAQRHRKLVPHIDNLYRLFKVLAQARGKRGAIDFETIETQIIFDEQGKIARIVPVRRNDAHRVIEECMLAANVCTSDFLRKRKQPMLYRVHEGPTPEKLAALRVSQRLRPHAFGRRYTDGEGLREAIGPRQGPTGRPASADCHAALIAAGGI